MSVPLEDLPSHVPTSPAIYALHGGTAGNRRVAYVGQARNLRIRLRQHLLLRDSSITTGAAVVSLNPDLVRAVDWWTHDGFSDSVTLEAAELVAFDVLDPTLRSQGWPSLPARELSSKTQFIESFRKLFLGPPSASLTIERLAGLSARIQNLEARLDLVEREMKQRRQNAHD